MFRQERGNALISNTEMQLIDGGMWWKQQDSGVLLAETGNYNIARIIMNSNLFLF